MLLYKKSFPLMKGLRFSSYIKRLDEQAFPPYTLLIEKTAESDRVKIEILQIDFTVGFDSFVTGGILLNECTVQYSREERSFTIFGSISNWNLIMPLFYISIAICCFLFIIFSSIISGSFFEVTLYALLILIAFLSPFIAMYSNERKLLNRIGQVGAE